MSARCRDRALCVAVSVLKKCTMARNYVANMVIEASDIRGAAGGTRGVAGGSAEVASGIDGAARTSGIDSVGSSSYCSCSACTSTRDAGLGGAASGAE